VLEKKVIKSAVNAILFLREAKVATQSILPQTQTVGDGLEVFKEPLTGEQAAIAFITKFSPEDVLKDIQGVYEQNRYNASAQHSPEEIQAMNAKVLAVLQGKYSDLISKFNPQFIQESKIGLH
jgi:hypothetical protein